MSKFVKKSNLCEVFEYGSGDFPTWFNSLVGTRIKLSRNEIFTPKNEYGQVPKKDDPKIIAGTLDGENFYYTDIIVRDKEGNIETYDKYDFVDKFLLVPED